MILNLCTLVLVAPWLGGLFTREHIACPGNEL
jgi:hypothetical protein